MIPANVTLKDALEAMHDFSGNKNGKKAFTYPANLLTCFCFNCARFEAVQ